MFRWLFTCLTLLLSTTVAAQQTQDQAFQALAEYVEANFHGLRPTPLPPVASAACDYTKPGRTHALVMGAADAGSVQPRMLGGSENSAALISATLEHLGVDPTHIATLTGLEATRSGFETALTDLRGRVDCTDTVFIYLTAVMTSTRLLSQQLYGRDEPRDWIAEGADTNPALRRMSAASPFLMFNTTQARPNDLLSASALSDIIADLRNRTAHVTLVLDTAFAGQFDLQERQARRDPRALWSAAPQARAASVTLTPNAGAFSLFYSADAYSYAAQWSLPQNTPDARVYGVFAYKLSAALYADAMPSSASVSREIDGLRLGDRTAEYENHQIESTDPGAALLAELGEPTAPPSTNPSPTPAPEAEQTPNSPIPASDVIRITAPAATRAAAALEDPVVSLSGHVEWPEQTMIVLVNRAQALSRPDGTFQHELTLEPGLNRIEIVALTRDNRQHRKVLELSFEGDVEALTGSGNRYAILIANQNYGPASGMPSLSTPFADIDAIGAELTTRYGFRTTATLPDGSDLPLVLRDASRSQIETLLFQMSRIAGEKDTVLIYYGGHGIYEQMTDTAFWVPSDAVAGVPPTYLSASSISEALLRLQAGNVLVVSDSCYSGALMRGGGEPALTDSDRLRALQRLADKRSRVLITSGANEPVADEGGDGHSVFARAFLNGLRQSERDVFSARELFDRDILPFVVGRSGQEPQYRPIARSGHEGGDVVFVASDG